MIAPVVLFVYNRVHLTHQTIEALRNNYLSEQSELIIFSDGPKDNEIDYEKVNNLRKYIEKIEGFKKIEIIKAEKNKGLATSIISGVTEIVNKYGKIIVLEDDLVTSPFFLKYMNEALNMYEDCEKVISIHGFVFPVKSKLPDTFFLKGADCWGWATWKRGWDLFEKDGNKLLQEIERKKLEYEFDFNGGYPYTEMLKHQIEGKVDSWAIRWYASAFLNNKLTLYPGKSLIGNIGMNEGTHCKNGENILNLYNKEIKLKKIKIEENLRVKKVIIREYFKKGKKNRIIEILDKIKAKISSFKK